MPRDTDVFCLHCQRYMPRSRERAHRAKLHIPKYSPPPPLPSRLKRVFDIEPELATESEEPRLLVPSEGGRGEQAIQAARYSILERWRLDRYSHDRELENQDGENVDFGSDEFEAEADDLNVDLLHWDAIDAGSGLSPWDRLGEGFEKDAASASEELSSAR